MSKKHKSALSWIIRSSRPQFVNIILLAIVYGVNAFIGVYNTEYARELVDAAVNGAKGGSFDEVIRYGLLYFGVTVIQIVTLILARNFGFKVSARLDMSMKSDLFYTMMMLKPEHSRAHMDGDIHIHDLDFYSLTMTCCQIDLIKLFKNGFNTGHGHLREPKDIRSYAALAAIAIQSNQNDQHGGQSVPNFDYAMEPGVIKTFRKQYFSLEHGQGSHAFDGQDRRRNPAGGEKAPRRNG